MLIFNFSHPLTQEQLSQIEILAQQKINRVQEIKTQFDHQQQFVPQLAGLVDKLSLSKDEFQSLPIIINLPSFNIIACLVLAELHGRMGYFPPVIRLRPVEGIIPPKFEVAEIINLQKVRDIARDKR